MPYQLFMVAAPVRLAILFLWQEAESLGFRKVTPVIEGEGGLSGFCVLHHADRAHQDDPLARFLKTWLGREEAIKGQSTSVQLVGGRLPAAGTLRKEWSDWVKSLQGAGGKAQPAGRQNPLELNFKAIDQALAEGVGNVFTVAERVKRQREFEQCVAKAKEPEKSELVPEVDVVPGRQEILSQARAMFRPFELFSDKLSCMKTMEREGLVRDGLPPLAWEALEQATSPREDEQVLALLKRVVSSVATGHEDHQKLNRLMLLAGADPALFLPFCRPQPLAPEQQRELFDRLQESLAERFFGRTELVGTVAANLTRRLAGDPSVLTLLLHGPPGTGKSFLVTQLAEALTAAGVTATTVFQAMTEGGSWRGDEQLLFQLTGSATHYSNGDCGSLFRSAKSPQHRLSLVLLDEAEKCGQRDFLVNLLDPRLPLEDSYIKGLVGAVDLRPKTVFFLSANDTAPLCCGVDDPLWSRLQPAWLRPYSREELEQILVRKVQTECPFQPGSKTVHSVVKRILDQDGGVSSLRKLLDAVNSALFLHSLDRPGLLEPRQGGSEPPTRRPIGFRP